MSQKIKWLNQPSFISVLTLAELKDLSAVLLCSFSPSKEVDSVNLLGFYKAFSGNLKEIIPLQTKATISSRLKKHQQQQPPNLLYI